MIHWTRKQFRRNPLLFILDSFVIAAGLIAVISALCLR